MGDPLAVFLNNNSNGCDNYNCEKRESLFKIKSFGTKKL